jgi:type IV pilus assembly protein PilW
MELKNVKQRSSKGFSIVELMVAILIGLIILAGVIQVVISSKTTFLGQEEMSFIQENARYAVDLLGKDIQSAGYWGCAGQGAKFAVAAKDNAAAPGLVGAQAVGGYSGSQYATMPDYLKTRVRGVGATAPVYSDVLIVRGAENSITGITDHDGATITTNPDHDHGLSDNAYFVIAGEDCRRLSIVQAATASGNTITYNATDNYSTAIKPSLLKASYDHTEAYESYSKGATVMKYEAKAYFIGNSSAITGFPALKRVAFSGGGVQQEELALGVEDMQIRYGVAGSGGVRYKSADEVTAAEWASVRSVQVQLVFRSQSASAQSAVEQEFLGKTYNDGFMRQLVSTTFRLRNRI